MTAFNTGDCPQSPPTSSPVESEGAGADLDRQWMATQLVNCISYAETLALVTDLAIARALVGDLRDALAALAAAGGGAHE